MKTAIRRTALPALLVIASTLLTAPAASAADCRLGVLCGKFKNAESSNGNLWIGTGWDGSRPTGSLHSLYPGQSSTMYLKDTDAIKVGRHCSFKIGFNVYAQGEKWYKIGDALNTRNVVVTCK
jgi:hypothetical protein